jgi:hypothetical protein
VPQTQTTYTIDWLSPGQTYAFYVTAVDKGAQPVRGEQHRHGDHAAGHDTTHGAGALGGRARALTGLADVDAVDGRPVDLRWASVLRRRHPITEHVSWWGERTVVLRHITPATSYTFTVHASDSSGNTATSNAVTLTTEASSDVTPPSAPTNARLLEDQGCAEVWLGWNPVHGRHRPSVRDRVRDLRQRCSEPACSRGRDRQGLRLRHGARREHVRREGGRSGGEHLGSGQPGDGGALALLRSGVADRMLGVG